jgi:ABC-2 type transport system permease protein
VVGTLVRLQLKLFARQLRANVTSLVLNIIFALGALGGVIVGFFAIASMRGADPGLLGSITVALFAVITFGWPIMTVLFTGSNEMLDIGRFALFPVRASQLIPGLLVVGLTGIGGIAVALLCISLIIAWSSSPLLLIGAVLGSVLGLGLCILASRTLTTAMSAVLRKRKARDLMMIGIFVLIMAVSMGLQVLPRLLVGDTSGEGVSFSQLGEAVERWAGYASYTPWGWAWGIPWSLAAGNWLIALGQFVGTLALIVLLWRVWTRQVATGLTSPLDQAVAGERIKGAAFYDKLLPYSPAGAIAKRTIRYYRRDPRRMMNLLTLFLIPIIMVVAGLMGSGAADDELFRGYYMAYSSVAVSWMIGIIVAAELCWDGSAIGTQIISGVSGHDDRKGRAIAVMFFFVPIQLIISIALLVIGGGWAAVPGVLALIGVLLLGGVGIGNFVGSFWQYAQPPAGGNMFAKGSSGGAAGFASSMLGMFLPIVAALPVVALLVGSMFVPWLDWVALPVGIGEGALLFWLGIKLGGRHLDQIWPEVLDRVTWKN